MAKKKVLTKAQEKVAKCASLVANCKELVHDVDLVHTIEHNIRHSKFAAADELARWMSENPTRKNIICNTVIINTSKNPTFSSVNPKPNTRLAELASERYTMLGTLDGSRVKEKGGRFRSQRKHLRTHW